MKLPHHSCFNPLRGIALLLMLFCSTNFAAAMADAALPWVTNALQFHDIIVPGKGRVCAFGLKGTALAIGEDSRTLLFQDESGSVIFNADLKGTEPRAGQSLRIQGTNFVFYTGTGFSLGTHPVVDNDGLHSAHEVQETIFLNSGMHDFQVHWFNRYSTALLEISYSGPDSPGQRIAFQPRRSVSEAAANNSPYEMKYRCFEGDWEKLPNFNLLAPTRSGSASSFDISVRTRPELVGLEFKGFWNAPQAGDYTFYVKSDDGSRLFLNSSPPTFTLQGVGPVPIPVSISPGQAFPGGPMSLWAEVEGTITFLNDTPNGGEFELTADGNTIRVELLNVPGGLPPYLLNSHVQVRGICPPIRNPHGQTCAGLIVAPDLQSLQILDIPQERWALFEKKTLSDLETAFEAGETDGTVYLKGKLRENPATKAFLFEDSTGAAPIKLLNGSAFDSETELDCLARWVGNETNVWLHHAICRRSLDTALASNDVPVLTTALQVQHLKPNEARREYPVQLHGVITWVSFGTATPSLVVQDATRAVYVSLGILPPEIRPGIGDFCRINGVTQPGEFSPIVELQKLTVLSKGQMPRAVKPTRDQIFNGSLDAQYVELRGMLTAAHPSYVTLLTAEGSVNINIAPEPAGSWSKLVGAVIRVRGCFFADWDKQTQRVILDDPILRLWAARTTIESHAPADLFQADRVPGTELMRFDAKFDPFQWIKISGQIIHGGPETYYLMDGPIGLSFRLTHPQDFTPGDVVEVVGLVELSGTSPLLRQAIVRKTGHAPMPEPRHLTLDSPSRRFDSTLVSVEGILVNANRRGAEEILEIQVGVKSFVARVRSRALPNRPWEIGSRLQLTGVFHALDNNPVGEDGVRSFELLLNSPADVRVLARPPWWTLGRLLTMAAILITGLALAGVWIALLRRQVERRTSQLHHEISQRQHAEKLRALEQERARIARDLHDDLGSELTDISMLACPGPGIEVDQQNAIDRLQGIARKSRTMVSALDGLVWVVNAKNDTLSSLIEYLASNAEESLANAGIAFRVEMPPKIAERKIPAEVRHDILLAVREALNNAIRHGRPNVVFMRFAVSDDGFEIGIKDDGCGFSKDDVTQGNGLENIQERVRTSGGACRIESTPNQGTSVTLKIPTHSLRVENLLPPLNDELQEAR